MHVRAWRSRAGRDGRARRSIAARTTLALLAVAIVATAGSAKSGKTDPGSRFPGEVQAETDSRGRFFSDLSWRCTGPFEGGPIASIQGIAGTPGVYTITTPSGGVWQTRDGGDNWSSLDASTPASASGARQWIDPANPHRIARITGSGTGIEVTLNAGATWMPASQHLPIAEVARISPRELPRSPGSSDPGAERRINGSPATVSIADPVRPGLIFAGTKTGVFVSFDAGATWSPLALNMPAVAINDLDIRGHDLVAATQGRSIWILEDISPLRQIAAINTSAPAILFAPANVTLPRIDVGGDSSDTGAFVDYYVGPSVAGDVTIEVLNASGRVVHRAQSAAPDASDRWLPVMPPLSKSPGHHRVIWNLRIDPPPSPHHRFAQAARPLFEHAPAEPDGPQVLAGAYRVRLTAGGRSYVQPLVVQNDPRTTPTDLLSRRQQFALAMNAYDAMDIAHRGFLQLARARVAIRPLLASTDPDLAKLATDLDARLNTIDGSDWTGLVIPDADNEAGEIDEAKEGKHPDFVPPKPVSLSKDYDDPTSILGRAFGNVTHAPAFAILGLTLGDVVTKTDRATTAPDALALGTFTDACQQLAGVLDEWRAINAQDLPLLNVELGRQKLPPLPIAASIPVISCATGTTRR